METKLYDVIIVGGGFAGISAARELHRANKDILVLEARDRLGGRVHSVKILDGIDIELGGQWIGPTQDHMYELVKEYGIKTYPTYDEGYCVLDLNQKISRYKGLIPKVDALSLLYIDRTIKNLDKMAKSISVDSPWTHPKSLEWDSLTLGSYLQKTVKRKKAYSILRTGLETVLACSPSEVSLLHTLFYIKSGKNIDTLLNIKNGAQQDRIKGGMQQIIQSMANNFLHNVKFKEAVHSIVQKDNKCHVNTSKATYHSKKVIMAIPPVLASCISYTPLLSINKRQMLQKIPMGTVVKCYAIYKKPFWREKGYSGEAVTDEGSPYQTIFDNGPAHSDYGVLMGFAIADRANKLMQNTLEERKEIMIKTLVKYFGQEAAEIRHYEDKCWADEEYSQGCYAGYLPPGIWTKYQDSLRTIEGHIHWAGTETATIWNGYIEGAVITGIRAAKEIKDLL